MKADIEVTWLGHAAWLVRSGSESLIIDPFLDDSPVASMKAKDVRVNYVLVSHGHADHVGDAAMIARNNKATLLSNYEITEWFRTKHGVEDVIGMNLGGSVSLPIGRVKLTLAFHSSQLPDGSYGGNPGGFLLSLSGTNLYFACDTALFGDMRQIGAAKLDLAVLPIGDLFTMGVDDAVEAIKLLQPCHVMPAHYNTWPVIAQDAEAWAKRVREETPSKPIVLQPGQSFRLPT